LASGADSPSFLAKSGDTIFAVGEADATVSAFRIAGDDLHFLGTQPTAGTAPCAIGTFADGTVVGVACYGDGVIDLHAVGESGALGKTFQSLRGSGSSIRPEQDGPHAHAVVPIGNDIVLTTDLGTDAVHIHRASPDGLARTGAVSLPAGSGPRDLHLHESGAVWVLAELSGELIAIAPIDGNPYEFELVNSVPLPGADPADHAAGIAVSSDGRHVYVGLRGSDRIAIVAVNPDGRRFEPVGYVDCGGAWPRHLVVDGDFLRVANQLSNSVVTFEIPDDGIPILHSTLPVASPTYLLLD
jgi:6-phosphogluconolactonase (cycloisomerase 2 family)